MTWRLWKSPWPQVGRQRRIFVPTRQDNLNWLLEYRQLAIFDNLKTLRSVEELGLLKNVGPTNIFSMMFTFINLLRSRLEFDKSALIPPGTGACSQAPLTSLPSQVFRLYYLTFYLLHDMPRRKCNVFCPTLLLYQGWDNQRTRCHTPKSGKTCTWFVPDSGWERTVFMKVGCNAVP